MRETPAASHRPRNRPDATHSRGKRATTAPARPHSATSALTRPPHRSPPAPGGHRGGQAIAPSATTSQAPERSSSGAPGPEGDSHAVRRQPGRRSSRRAAEWRYAERAARRAAAGEEHQAPGTDPVQVDGGGGAATVLATGSPGSRRTHAVTIRVAPVDQARMASAAITMRPRRERSACRAPTRRSPPAGRGRAGPRRVRRWPGTARTSPPSIARKTRTSTRPARSTQHGRERAAREDRSRRRSTRC